MFNNLCISDLCPRIFRYTTHFLFTSASGFAFISPIPPPWRYLSSLFLWGALGSFVCVQRCEAHLLRPGGHLGIKKCQTTGHSPYRPPIPKASPLPLPIYWHQSTKHYYFDPLPSQSKIVLCTSCFGSILLGVSMLMLPPSHPANSFLLRNHRWLCGRK